MTARRVGSALGLVILVTSAIYLLVYLYRWEWNRALIAGLFFVSAEVAVMGTSLLRRLRRIEQKLDEAAARPLEHLRSTAPEPKDTFRWLDDSTTHMNVFVPVLLGAGVVLSVIAHGVERLAASTARPTLERGLANRLAALALPQGGLLAPTPAPVVTVRTPASRHRTANRLFVVAVAVLGALVTFQGIDLIADATQTRADAIDHSSSLELTIQVKTKGRVAGEEDTAEALWVACRGVLNRHVNTMTDDPQRLAPGVYRLQIQPAVGSHGRRRLQGCLEDSTLDRITGRVVSMVEVRP
jgi:hypothetical protein